MMQNINFFNDNLDGIQNDHPKYLFAKNKSSNTQSKSVDDQTFGFSWLNNKNLDTNASDLRSILNDINELNSKGYIEECRCEKLRVFERANIYGLRYFDSLSNSFLKLTEHDSEFKFKLLQIFHNSIPNEFHLSKILNQFFDQIHFYFIFKEYESNQKIKEISLSIPILSENNKNFPNISKLPIPFNNLFTLTSSDVRTPDSLGFPSGFVLNAPEPKRKRNRKPKVSLLRRKRKRKLDSIMEVLYFFTKKSILPINKLIYFYRLLD